MSRTALAVVVAVLVLGAAGAGLLLWERNRARKDTDDKPRAQRLLIGLNPQTVRRVRFRWKNRTVEVVKRHGVWEPATGTSLVSTIRVDVLLGRIATLQVQLLRRRSDGRTQLGTAVADIKVWRGRARPVVVRLYKKSRGLWLTTSDRPGVYKADGKLLVILRQELREPPLKPVWPLKVAQLASVEIKTTTSVTLVRRKGRWFLEDSAALAPADGTAVGKLLQELQLLRVTHTLGQGEPAVTKHGLDKAKVTLRVDDGTKRSLRLGGPCPRSKQAVVATLGGKNPTVVCVTRPAAGVLKGPFINTQLFSASADEIKAINITRGKKNLALANRPGSGGWKMISPNEGKVDQVAAASFVADLTRLKGQLPAAGSPKSPTSARRVGSVLLTPMVGSEERLELHGSKKDAVLWVRRIGGSRWFHIRAADQRLLAADPVLLHNRNLCAEPGKKFLHVVKTHPGKVTELLASRRGNWQLVLLAGRVGFKKAKRIGAQLQDYKPAAKQSTQAPVALGWKRPVLLVGDPDRVHLSTLLLQLKSVRAQSFVASRARKKHGFGASLRLSYRYLHSCKDDNSGKKVCQTASCSLEVGAERTGGGCYARQTSTRAVFVASAALCAAARAPVASRRVVNAAMHRLASIVLRHKGKTRRLIRTPGRGWKRPKQISALAWESATGALIQLAPLNARKVAGYGSGGMRDRLLTVTLKIKDMPAIGLDFYDDDSDPALVWMVRSGLPVRYKVSKAMVTGLVRLAVGK